MTTPDLDALKSQLAELTEWRRTNIDLVGTPEFTRKTKLQRLLVDLVDRDGGTPEDLANFIKLAAEL